MSVKKQLFNKSDFDRNNLFVVKQYFNSINHQYFLILVEEHLNKIGRGNEYTGCEFAEELDEWEEQFEGVRCWFGKQEVFVTESDFFTCLREACIKRMQFNSGEKSKIQKILAFYEKSIFNQLDIDF